MLLVFGLLFFLCVVVETIFIFIYNYASYIPLFEQTLFTIPNGWFLKSVAPELLKEKKLF